LLAQTDVALVVAYQRQQQGNRLLFSGVPSASTVRVAIRTFVPSRALFQQGSIVIRQDNPNGFHAKIACRIATATSSSPASWSLKWNCL